MAQICTMTPVAEMVGSHRIVQGSGIVHPLGLASSSPEEERRCASASWRARWTRCKTDVDQPTVFK